MKIKNMLLKDIKRDIRGVIKADQTNEVEVYNELEEYVVTHELHQHFAKFYDNYLKGIDGKTDNVGVWISGFFGSGKSHFLKILAYLLENKPVKGKTPVELFADKISDVEVYEKIKRVATVPTETILFNIDSKSLINNKLQEDAILRVLLKVFYEHQGYYGDNLVVAELEKYLAEHSYYESYKKEFEKIANEPWENRRHSFHFDSHLIKRALLRSTDMTEKSIDHWLKHGVDQIDISIEKFAKDVKAYIDSKSAHFHLVFFIDEVGQYIGDRRDLMLNLQTITESLGAICKGQAWVVVTAQESIDSFVKGKADDFSRILGRFDTRLSLSSVSVDEVIQKRILEKQPSVEDILKSEFHDKRAVLNNIISFQECTVELQGFQNEQEFATVYPFIPYQFKLLQHVFERVRNQCSSGKHLSAGERSLLSAYREAGLRYMNEEKGTLIPFYAFYDTIKDFLLPTVSRVIDGAYNQAHLIEDSFHKKLLKVLFMVKYVKEVPANIDNIATLMVTHIAEDKLKLKEKINTSLSKLIGQNLVQKNGEEYVFLTAEEQAVNREIKALSIEEDLIKRELAHFIFQDLYDEKRFRYSKQYTFLLNQQMDGKIYGNQTAHIGINILSPLSDKYHHSEQELMLLSSESSDIVIRLGGDGNYIEEIEEALKIADYYRKRHISQFPEVFQQILNDKQVELRERRRRAHYFIEEAIKEGTFYINGNKVDVTGSTVREKINHAFKQLVNNLYTHLAYVKEFTLNKNDLQMYLKSQQEYVELADVDNPNGQAFVEIENFIRLQAEYNKEVRMKTLYDRFCHSPYGWRKLDIARIVAELLKKQKIRIRYNVQNLDPINHTNTLMAVFTKMTEADKARIDVRKQVDERLIRSVRRMTRELFDIRDIATDEDGLISDIHKLFDDIKEEIKAYLVRYKKCQYPGKRVLDKGLQCFSRFDKTIEHVTFFNEMIELEEDFADWFDDFYYVRDFFNTNKQELFEEGAIALARYEDFKRYVQTEEIAQAMNRLRTIINDPVPYGKIKHIPSLVNILDEQMARVLKMKKIEVKEKIQLDFDELLLQTNLMGITEETKVNIQEHYETMMVDVEVFEDLYRLDALITQSHSYKLQMIQVIKSEIKLWQREQEANGKNEHALVTDAVSENAHIFVETIKLSELAPVKTLKTKEDVDKYANLLSRKLKQMINENKEIELI